MRRCLDLALLGSGYVAPNPMVGSVLVYTDPDTGEERIIGEGYHERYGERHAEANCIASVLEEDRLLIARSTIYVSLEPCAHYGKQPPCADLIIRERIPRVVVGCRDPFPQVNGKGIERLRAAGVEVVVGVSEEECVELNGRFFTFHTKHRPYIVLKWAQSADGKIGGGVRTLISNDYSNRLVHKWRAEESAILVGTRTALLDDPALTVRLWNGPGSSGIWNGPGSSGIWNGPGSSGIWNGRNPVRLVIDKELRLPLSLQLFDGKVRTVVFNLLRHEEGGAVEYYQLSPDSSLVHQLGVALTRLKITSVLVEGGAKLLQSFIEVDHWDEARVITNNELMIPGGLPAPELKDAKLERVETLAGDMVRYYRHEQ
jgi:diaminohydroxyphosphoribosylaminopyrimidine deaminase/5-amino-6-(5-phosphoribosylamino)uracil reductase